MMSKRTANCVAALALVTLPGSAHAASGPLQPLKPWVLDYGETQCAATRQYGDPERPIIFGIRAAPNGETYEIIISKAGSGPRYAVQIDGSIESGGKPLKLDVLKYSVSESPFTLYQYRVTKAQMAQIQSAPQVTLKMSEEVTTFALRSTPEVLDGLGRCTADLMRYWNMDGKKIGTLAELSKGDVRYIFSSSDYPDEAIRRYQTGTAQYMLLIDEAGRVAGCHLVRTSRAPTLDAMGCQVIRVRGRFKPARDRAGNPVRSTYVTPPITWDIQG